MINRQTNSDPANFLILAVPTLIVGYLIYRVFGFVFILENGPFFLGAALLVVVLRMRLWWPAAFLLAQVPFQGLLVARFGLMANLMSLAAVVAFLSTQSPKNLPTVLFGTTTQKLAALAVLGVSVSMLWDLRRHGPEDYTVAHSCGSGVWAQGRHQSDNPGLGDCGLGCITVRFIGDGILFRQYTSVRR